MSLILAAFVGLCLYGLIRVLNLASPSLPPSIYSKTRNSEFIQAIMSSCPILREPYVPPLLWGKSGHIQTVVYAKIGRMRDPVPSGTRHFRTLQDGSTLTFDVYQPTGDHCIGGQYCMLVCPGFGSSSESAYIRALVNHAQSYGYMVAVLNHLGCVYSQRLTAPRIFSYGGWEEFHIMRQEMEAWYPSCRLILVGLSMGANIILKYLGENTQHQQGIWCAMSICQGYNINEAKMELKKWQNMRRAYLYTMTANHRRLLKRHSDMLFQDEVRVRFGLDVKKILAATTMEDLDLHFTCKLQGYQDVVDYYESCSCSNFISNIDVPLILLNSEDDPIVPPPLFKYARAYTATHDLAAFITTAHGGHLGYFENGLIRPHSTTWVDRFVCQVSDAVITFTLQKNLFSAGPSPLHLSMQLKRFPSNQRLETADTDEPSFTDDEPGESSDLTCQRGLNQDQGARDALMQIMEDVALLGKQESFLPECAPQESASSHHSSPSPPPDRGGDEPSGREVKDKEDGSETQDVWSVAGPARLACPNPQMCALGTGLNQATPSASGSTQPIWDAAKDDQRASPCGSGATQPIWNAAKDDQRASLCGSGGIQPIWNPDKEDQQGSLCVSGGTQPENQQANLCGSGGTQPIWNTVQEDQEASPCGSREIPPIWNAAKEDQQASPSGSRGTQPIWKAGVKQGQALGAAAMAELQASDKDLQISGVNLQPSAMGLAGKVGTKVSPAGSQSMPSTFQKLPPRPKDDDEVWNTDTDPNQVPSGTNVDPSPSTLSLARLVHEEQAARSQSRIRLVDEASERATPSGSQDQGGKRGHTARAQPEDSTMVASVTERDPRSNMGEEDSSGGHIGSGSLTVKNSGASIPESLSDSEGCLETAAALDQERSKSLRPLDNKPSQARF